MRPFKALLTATCTAAVLAVGFAVASPSAEAETIRIGDINSYTRLPAHTVHTTGLSSVIERRTSNTFPHVSHSYVYAGMWNSFADRFVPLRFYPLSGAGVLPCPPPDFC